MNVEYKFLNYNVLDFANNPLYFSKILGGKDLIYSIGLFDYLPDRIIKNLILFFYSLLNQN